MWRLGQIHALTGEGVMAVGTSFLLIYVCLIVNGLEFGTRPN